MIILNPDAEEERQQELLERVQQIIRGGGGVVDHLDDWGRRKMGYAMSKRPDGRYLVLTCSATAEALAEAQRVMSITTDVVTRHLVIRHNRVQAERQKVSGAPMPADDRPDGEARPQRAGRGGGGRGRRPR